MSERNHNWTRWGWRFLAVMTILIVGIVIGAVLPLRPERQITPPSKLPPAKEDKISSPPVPLLPLDRAQLLAASAAAADAIARDQPLPARNINLIGRSFVIRLPFGCKGPQIDLESVWAGWTYDPKTSALKLQAQLEIWSDAPWIKAIAGETPFEAVEGFWIRRPWTSAESCPVGSSEEPGAQAGDISERQTIGIAQFFAPGGPRTMRRGTRPYAVTLKAGEDVAAKPHQYRLFVSGRITGFADGQPVHCWNETNNLRPVCLIGAEFSRVAFEDATDGSTLSEWRN